MTTLSIVLFVFMWFMWAGFFYSKGYMVGLRQGTRYWATEDNYNQLYGPNGTIRQTGLTGLLFRLTCRKD